MPPEDIQQLVTDKIVKLPLIERSVAELLTVLNRPVSNYAHIVDRLSPEVAARFLDMANSARPGHEVKSLSHAAQLLGYGHMKKILVSSILMDQFTRHLPYFDFNRFQTQSLFCAVLARIIGRIIDYENPEDLFAAGVLHNIGKQIIAVHFQDAHREIVRLKNEAGMSTREAEEQVLGTTHAEVGATVLEQLNIPAAICDAVRCHNQPLHRLPPSPEGELVRVVHTASRIVSLFTLPDRFPTLSLERRLSSDIDLRREEHKLAVAESIRSVGYSRAFPKLLQRVSEGLVDDLKQLVRLRADLPTGAPCPQ